jgi:hypothetical protein
VKKSGHLLLTGMYSGKRKSSERASGYPKNRGNRMGMKMGIEIIVRFPEAGTR